MGVAVRGRQSPGSWPPCAGGVMTTVPRSWVWPALTEMLVVGWVNEVRMLELGISRWRW